MQWRTGARELFSGIQVTAIFYNGIQVKDSLISRNVVFDYSNFLEKKGVNRIQFIVKYI